MTLTGLIRPLVDQFLPDSQQHYLFENYRQMEIYRMPADLVPDYLKGRPRTFIKHCLVRKTRSNKFTGDSVQQTDTPGLFHIKKDDVVKHTIIFGRQTGEEMPSCTCKDWVRWQIPCKHFFAIFREVPEWSWQSLPAKYLQSAYLSTDNEALSEYFSSKGVPQKDLSFFSGPTEQPSTSPNIPDVSVGHSDISLDQGSHPDTHLSDEIINDIPKREKVQLFQFVLLNN